MAKMQLSKIHNRIAPRLLLAFVVVVVVAFLLIVSVTNIAGKYFRIRREIHDLKTQQALLEKKETALQSTNAYLATPEGQEQALRDKYNVVKSGEGMIIITPTNTQEAPQTQERGIGKWWDKLLHGLGVRK